MKILIVDDDQGTLNALSLGLWSTGYEVVTAKDGREALDILASSHDGEERVQLLITDMQMPEMNGLELIKSARKLTLNIPAILITAYGNPRLESEIMQLGRCGYMEKPFAPETLLDGINEITKGV